MNQLSWIGDSRMPRAAVAPPASPLATAAHAYSWFLVFTKPQGEETAKVNLQRQGYTVYFPRLLRPTLARGRWIDRIVALFPRYLFVQLETGRQALAPVASTLGVANLVRFGPEYVVVSDRIVDEIKDRADAVSGLHRLQRCPTLKAGAKVRVTAGVLGGLDGILQREAAEDRIVVLLSILGRETPVRVPARFVQPLLAGAQP